MHAVSLQCRIKRLSATFESYEFGMAGISIWK